MTGWLDDLRERVRLARGSATLLIAIVDHDAHLDEARVFLLDLLRVSPLTVVDLGVTSRDVGPRRWAEQTSRRAADVYVLCAAPTSTPLELSATMRLYNAEREWLTQLSGPVLLIVSRAAERSMRQLAPDFFTWAAKSYELPDPRDISALATQQGISPLATAHDEAPVRFLHLSDIHLRPQRVKRYDQDRVLRGLLDFLKGDRASFALDLIFVTGDLANAGKAEEYSLVASLLTELMEVTGVPRERVFVVPGNHDVDRDVGRWLLRTLSNDEASIAFFEDAASRAFHLTKLDAYAKSMRELLGEGRALGLAVGEEAVELVEVRGARVAVASFNSAWFAQGDDDQNKLWMGESNVSRAGQRVADMEAPFAVALFHHPVSELHESERDAVEHHLERSFDVVLRGHLHKDKTRAIATQRGGFIEIAAPAAYQGSQWPNGCFLGEIRAKARSVRLRPYAYASGTDGWVLDTKVFPDDEADGYRHTFTVSEKRRLKSAAVKGLESAGRALLLSASPAQQRRVAEELGVKNPGAPPESLLQTTLKTAQSGSSDPAVVQRIVGAVGPEGQQVALALTTASELNAEGARIVAGDPDFLERALFHVGRAFLRAKATLGLTSVAPRVAMKGLNGAFGMIVDPPSQATVQSASQTTIFLGGPEHPSVVEVTQISRGLEQVDYLLAGGSFLGGPDHPSVVEVTQISRGLEQVDRLLAGGSYTQGAVIFLNALSPTETEPRLKRATTPAGHDVLVLLL